MNLPAPKPPPSWRGFDGRLTLTPEEWDTYQRRPPLRRTLAQYPDIRRPPTCGYRHCSVPAESSKPITLVHGIGFDFGVHELGLTPEWLDSPENLVGWAHAGNCNKRLGVPEELEPALRHLLALRQDYFPPSYLPAETQAAFKRLNK